ncbi:MAG: tRNA U34 5-methylaminomethyl-2-thiouridine-forming methyltransferase MnmC [Rhodothermales bacterium]|jgi:tRNA U34 5-methylaminomethyl-2-thiouridine-forming methyltransferase MnmC
MAGDRTVTAITWSDGRPRSERYDDTYYSAAGGLDEARTVFLEANRIAERLRSSQSLVVGELGFGTGLNFLATWQLWRELKSETRLTFISTEAHLLGVEDVARAHEAFPELAEFATLLQARWPTGEGFHLLEFDGARVRLLLLVGDALAMLKECDAHVHAWYLDGFSPATNPAMWSLEVFTELARLSEPGTTLGTWCAAGHVRRALATAGFEVKRVPGHGKKRHRTVGELRTPQISLLAPWLRWPAARQGPVLILGAGLAGCSLAAALARRGREVCVCDPDGIAAGASGNPIGLVQPTGPEKPWLQLGTRLIEQRDIGTPMDVQTPEGPAQGRLVQPAELCRAMLPVPIVRVQPKQRFAAVIDCRGPATLGVPIKPVRGQLVFLAGRPPDAAWCGGHYLLPTPDGAVVGATYHPHDTDLSYRLADEEAVLQQLAEEAPAGCLDDLRPCGGRVGIRACTPDYLPALGPLPNPLEWQNAYAYALRHGRPWQDLPPALWKTSRYVLTGLGSHGIASSQLAAEVVAAHFCNEPQPIPRSQRLAVQAARFLIRDLRRGRVSNQGARR